MPHGKVCEVVVVKNMDILISSLKTAQLRFCRLIYLNIWSKYNYIIIIIIILYMLIIGHF